jgi:acetyl-CoA synthetase
MIADLAERIGLDMPALSDAAASRLHDILGDRVHIANPLDYDVLIWGDRDALFACFSAMLSNRYDCTILVIDYPRPDICSLASWELAELALTDACKATGQRAVILATLPENIPAIARERLMRAGIMPMQGLNECLIAIRSAATIGEAQGRAHEIVALPAPVALGDESHLLNEWDSKQALHEFGLPIPQGTLCSASDAAETASSLGFPVAVKVVADDIAHKTEAGAVRLDVGSAEDVASAVAEMSHLSERFLIEKMLSSPVAELIVGIKQDPLFGLVLVIGAGGILVELVRDSAMLLLPTTRGEIASAVASLQVSRLLGGFRGRPAGDTDAAINAIEAVAAYAEAHRDSLLELDVNPLLVLPAGQGVAAVDALIRTTQR